MEQPPDETPGEPLRDRSRYDGKLEPHELQKLEEDLAKSERGLLYALFIEPLIKFFTASGRRRRYRRGYHHDPHGLGPGDPDRDIHDKFY